MGSRPPSHPLPVGSLSVRQFCGLHICFPQSCQGTDDVMGANFKITSPWFEVQQTRERELRCTMTVELLLVVLGLPSCCAAAAGSGPAGGRPRVRTCDR